MLPACNTEATQLHLDEIATKVTPGAHAILILDQAGWHGAKDLKVPSNISLLPLPPRAPELNSQENIWQFMRQNWLSGVPLFGRAPVARSRLRRTPITLDDLARAGEAIVRAALSAARRGRVENSAQSEITLDRI